MHRKHLRATVTGTDVDIPIGTLAAGQFLRYFGGEITTGIAGDVIGPASATDLAIARFDGVSGRLIQNSVVLISDVGQVTGVTALNGRDIARWVDGPSVGSTTLAHVAIWSDNTSRLIEDSGLHVNDIVRTSVAEVTTGHLAEFGDSTGRVLVDSGVPADNVVQHANASTDNALARWDGVTGNFLQNSVVTLSDVGQILGVTALNTRDIARWVDGPSIGGATDNAVALWDTTTGRLLKNSVVTITTGGDISTPGDMNPSSIGAIPVGVLVKSSGGTPHPDTSVARWRAGAGNPIDDSTVFLDNSGNLTGLGTLNTRTIASWVDGPASATDNAIARFDTTTGKLIQNSVVTVDDSGNIAGVGTLNTRSVSQFVTSATSSVADFEIVLWQGTTGRSITGSGIQWNQVAFLGSPFANDNRLVRTDTATNNRAVQQSGITVDDSNNITGVTTLNTIAPSNIVTGFFASAVNDVPYFTDTSGRVIRSSGLNVNNVVTSSSVGAGTDNAIVRMDGITGKLVQNSTVIIDDSGNVTGMGTLNGATIANWVVGPASATSGRIAVYNGATGKLIQNGTKLEADVVTGPASATDNAVARFDSTTGKLIQNSLVTVSDTGVVGGVATVNGVTVETHAARHQPGGADAMFSGSWTGRLAEWGGSAWLTRVIRAVLTTGGAAGSVSVLTGTTVALTSGSAALGVAFIPYSLSDTGLNVTVTCSWSNNTTGAQVMCGNSGGRVTSSGGSVVLSSTTPNGIPAVGTIIIVWPGVATGTAQVSAAVAISGSGGTIHPGIFFGLSGDGSNA
jgi:hypothetical protein